MMVARKLLAIVSDSGEPIVSLTTDRKLLMPITTAIAVVSQTTRIRGLQFDRDQPPVRQPGRKHRVCQPVDAEDDPDDRKGRIEECPDIASQHAEIVQEEERRDKEGAKRGSRQERRPESDRKTAEIGRIFGGGIRLEEPAEHPPSPDEQHGGGHQRKKGGAKHRLELELEDEFQPRGDGPVETVRLGFDVVGKFSVERIRQRITFGQEIAEQVAAQLADLLDQLVDADRKGFRLAEHGIDLGLFGGQRLALAGDDLGFGLPVGRGRAELLEASVDFRQSRPKRRGARQQFASQLLELEPDLDQLGVLGKVAVQPLLEFVSLPGEPFDERLLLIDDGAVALPDSLCGRAKRPGCRRGEEHEENETPEACKQHDIFATCGFVRPVKVRGPLIKTPVRAGKPP